MLRVKHSFNATDAEGNEVFIGKGDKISEITDAGPSEGYTAYDAHGRKSIIGWNVSFRLTVQHWTEIVTVDAVKLLKALEGN